MRENKYYIETLNDDCRTFLAHFSPQINDLTAFATVVIQDELKKQGYKHGVDYFTKKETE